MGIDTKTKNSGVDNYGRTIDYLRIAITDRCNYRCVYCMPASGVPDKQHNRILSFEQIERIVRVASEFGIKHLRLTGGEPLVRKGCTELAGMLSAIPGIEDIAITTNGALLRRDAKALIENGVSRVNVSLDTLDPEIFHTITRIGSLDDVLDGINAALEAGFKTVKINTVAVRALHQDFFSLARLSVEKPLHVRFIEYMPIGDDDTRSKGIPEESNPFFKDVSTWSASDTIPSDELRELISREAINHGCGPLLPASSSRPDGYGPADYWKFENSKGTVGFISAMSNHFCSQCNRLRLTSDGCLRPCLFSDQEIPLRQALEDNDDEAIRAAFRQALRQKPDAHHTNDGTQRFMSQIGG
ncbi:MAG: GTP 3',8-cyclase MoaA [Coriobacteriales bacterium]|nr:GTP 3',8-cyclase MoaA [Coriobacteriales bacterium]